MESAPYLQLNHIIIKAGSESQPHLSPINVADVMRPRGALRILLVFWD